jgi:WD40 repeat protein
VKDLFLADSKSKQSGRCIFTIDYHHEPVTSAAWAPDGQTFVTGSLDSQSQLCLWDLRGRELYKWPGSYRVRDCAVSADGRRLIAISTDNKIYVYNFITREEEYSMSLNLDLTCINISRDCKYILVNMSKSMVQLLDIETAEVVRQYEGQKQGNFIIRSTFGGATENFVVSGSEGKSEPVCIRS